MLHRAIIICKEVFLYWVAWIWIARWRHGVLQTLYSDGLQDQKDPNVLVFHKNRGIKQFFLQRFSYGGFTADKLGKQNDMHFLLSCLPALFVIYLFLSISLYCLFELSPIETSIIFIPFVILLCFALIEALRLSEKPSHIPLLDFFFYGNNNARSGYFS